MAVPKQREMEMVMRRVPLSEEARDPEYVAYWRSKSVAERLAEVERLRQIMYGKDYGTTARLSRSDLRIERRRG